MRTALKSAAAKARSSRSGLTLIELIVAIAVSAIVMTSVITIGVLTYRACNASERQSVAQNLAVLTMQKIQNTVRYKGSVKIYPTPDDIPSKDNGTAIYYNAAEDGVTVGRATYLKGTFNTYDCELNFINSASAPGKLLEIQIEVKDKGGNRLYYTASSIYLMNGYVTGASEGSAITCS